MGDYQRNVKRRPDVPRGLPEAESALRPAENRANPQDRPRCFQNTLLGLKALPVIARAGARPTSGGPGKPVKETFKALKAATQERPTKTHRHPRKQEQVSLLTTDTTKGSHAAVERQAGEKSLHLFLAGQVGWHLRQGAHQMAQPVDLSFLDGQGFVLAAEHLTHLGDGSDGIHTHPYKRNIGGVQQINLWHPESETWGRPSSPTARTHEAVSERGGDGSSPVYWQTDGRTWGRAVPTPSCIRAASPMLCYFAA
jgi:hypothetical protein